MDQPKVTAENSAFLRKIQTTKSNSSVIEANEASGPNVNFPIVGIGASAGGLEAITKLLEHIPKDSGMAFVVIQHLAPEQDSMLADILARSTVLKVNRVEKDMKVEPNNLYVIPPTFSMTISNGHLKLEKESSRLHREVDQFLVSLAQDAKNLAIGVILSGTGSDGTEGLKAIYLEGGITFAQEEDSAKYPGMPHSAIASEVVHFVLTPEKIAEELLRIGSHPYLNREELKVVKPKIEDLTHYQKILAQLKIAFNVNFSSYKESTVNRRITRRMVLHQIEKIGDYANFLRNDKVEQQALFDDLLIGVTSFFREPETFQVIESDIWPTILKNKTSETPIRVWVAGCATGEEVYSLLISLKTYLEKNGKNIPIQFFGTDINEKNIEKARSGIYSQSLLESIPEETLQHFFKKVGQKYQISKAIRELCVFAKQDLMRDPPFSSLDLISCRNVLIYLKPDAQRKIIPLFHYALVPHGFLIIGKSESISGYRDLFAQVDKMPVYTRKTVPSKLPLDFELSEIFPKLSTSNGKQPIPERPIDRLKKEANNMLIERFSPPSVIVNHDLDVILFQGDTSNFLVHSTGEANLNLINMAREDLRLELQTALYLAKKTNDAVKRAPVRFKLDGKTHRVKIEVINVTLPMSEEKFYLILFEDLGKLKKTDDCLANIDDTTVNSAIVTNLRTELTSTKENLQTIIEEQEATNEELRSALEEGQSTNEELQSTNEELETAKEELQSTNEELNTVNEELSTRNRELIRSQDDMNNVFNSINVSVIVLDPESKIRFFTPTASKMFNLVEADVGRSIFDITLSTIVQNFEQLVKDAMQTLVPQQMQVQDKRNRWFDLNIRPYLTTEKKIDGTVLSFIDIDAILQQKAEIEKSRNFAQTIVATIIEPLIVINPTGSIVLANPSFHKTFKTKPKAIELNSIWKIKDSQFDFPELRKTVGRVQSEDTPIHELEIKHEFPEIGKKVFKVNISPISVVGSKEKMILMTLDDMSEQDKLNQELRSHTMNLERLIQEKTNELKDAARMAAIGQTAGMVGHDIRNPLQSIVSATYLLKDELSNAASSEEQKSLWTENLETIEDQTSYISKIILDLQDYGKPLKLKPETINVADFLTKLVSKTNIPKNVKVNLDIEKGLPELKTDAICIQRCIVNLLSNALQAMSNGGELTIQVAKAENNINIKITDTGVGIPENVKPHIFQPLFTTKSKGQGFGLAVCKRFVNALEGDITFTSSDGNGTTFKITLPISRTSN